MMYVDERRILGVGCESQERVERKKISCQISVRTTSISEMSKHKHSVPSLNMFIHHHLSFAIKHVLQSV